jgi:GT2 family glycosyltransferase
MLFQEYYAAAVRQGWFDACFYFDLLQSRGISIRATDLSLFEHYATIGWKGGLSPSLRFSVGRYLDEYRDVADSQVDPLYHHLVRGRREKRKAFALLEWPDEVRFPGQAESQGFAQSVLESNRLPVVFLCSAAADDGQGLIRRLVAALGQAGGIECFVIADGEAERQNSWFGLRELDGSGWSRAQKADYVAELLGARGDVVVVSTSLATAELLAPFATRDVRITSFLHGSLSPEDLADPAVSEMARCAHRIIVSHTSMREQLGAVDGIAAGDVQVIQPPGESGQVPSWAAYTENVAQCLRGLGNDGARIRLTGSTLGRQQIAEDLCVVIPSYNHKPYILAALDSILAQSLRPKEIRIIDDGSTDGSAELVGSLASPELGIFVEARENRGAQETMNQGIAETACPIVAVMNSDDRWHPLRIEELIGSLRGLDGADVVFSRLRFIGPPHRCEHKRAWYERGVADYRAGTPLWLALLFCNFFFTTSNLLARRDKFIEVGGFGPLRYCHDLDFMLKAMFAGHKVRFAQQTLCDYRVHDSNTIDEDVEKVVLEEAWIVAKFMRRRYRQLSEGERLSVAQRACAKGLAGRLSGILQVMGHNDGAYEDDTTVHNDPRLAGIGGGDAGDRIEPGELMRQMAELMPAADPAAPEMRG